MFTGMDGDGLGSLFARNAPHLPHNYRRHPFSVRYLRSYFDLRHPSHVRAGHPMHPHLVKMGGTLSDYGDYGPRDDSAYGVGSFARSSRFHRHAHAIRHVRSAADYLRRMAGKSSLMRHGAHPVRHVRGMRTGTAHDYADQPIGMSGLFQGYERILGVGDGEYGMGSWLSHAFHNISREAGRTVSHVKSQFNREVKQIKHFTYDTSHGRYKKQLWTAAGIVGGVLAAPLAIGAIGAAAPTVGSLFTSGLGTIGAGASAVGRFAMSGLGGAVSIFSKLLGGGGGGGNDQTDQGAAQDTSGSSAPQQGPDYGAILNANRAAINKVNALRQQLGLQPASDNDLVGAMQSAGGDPSAALQAVLNDQMNQLTALQQQQQAAQARANAGGGGSGGGYSGPLPTGGMEAPTGEEGAQAPAQAGMGTTQKVLLVGAGAGVLWMMLKGGKLKIKGHRRLAHA